MKKSSGMDRVLHPESDAPNAIPTPRKCHEYELHQTPALASILDLFLLRSHAFGAVSSLGIALLPLGTGLLTLSHSPLNALMIQFCSSVAPLALPSNLLPHATIDFRSNLLSYTILFALWKYILWSLSGNT